MTVQRQLNIKTNGRETINITDKINSIVTEAKLDIGMCNIFIKHTSASLMITENADIDVRIDIENYLQKTVIDGSPDYHHNNEGDFDMSGHIRSVLTASSISIPISSGKLALGIWQGLFLYEHRDGSFNRELVITCQ